MTSLASRRRDRYAGEARFSAARAPAMTGAMVSALARVHHQGLVRGKLYAHNIGVDDAGASLLGDFGAALVLPTDDPQRCTALQPIGRCAPGWLTDELAQRCNQPAALAALRAAADAD